jgi:MarR family transcriptional repressor of emrRAB
MSSSFKLFETKINHFASLHADAPKSEIVLNRLFLHVSKLFYDRQNLYLARFGLNTTSWSVLVMIYSTPGNVLNPCELSDALVSSRTNITRLSDELVKKGWIERCASTRDRRRVLLSLSDEGRRLIETVFPIQWQFLKELWSGFTQEEADAFGTFLTTLLHRLDVPPPVEAE